MMVVTAGQQTMSDALDHSRAMRLPLGLLQCSQDGVVTGGIVT